MGHLNIQVHMQQVDKPSLPNQQPRNHQEWTEVVKEFHKTGQATDVFRFNTTEPETHLAAQAKLCQKAIMHLAVMAGDVELLAFLQGRENG